MRAMRIKMSQSETARALARIEAALARIEIAATRLPDTGNDSERYSALRSRTQAALASLESVIQRAGGRADG
jgi:hypothetical protein